MHSPNISTRLMSFFQIEFADARYREIYNAFGSLEISTFFCSGKETSWGPSPGAQLFVCIFKFSENKIRDYKLEILNFFLSENGPSWGPHGFWGPTPHTYIEVLKEHNMGLKIAPIPRRLRQKIRFFLHSIYFIASYIKFYIGSL